MNVSWLVALSAALVSGHVNGSVRVRQGQQVCGMSAAQCLSVDRLIRAHRGWRLATARDNTDTLAVRKLRDSAADYSPYYTTLREGEKRTHFAVALTSGREFTVYYFRWRDSRYDSAKRVVSTRWLGEGEIRLQGDTLRVSPYHSDEIFLFAWSPTTRTLKLVPNLDDKVTRPGRPHV